MRATSFQPRPRHGRPAAAPSAPTPCGDPIARDRLAADPVPLERSGARNEAMIRLASRGVAASDLVANPVGRRNAHVLSRFADARAPRLLLGDALAGRRRRRVRRARPGDLERRRAGSRLAARVPADRRLVRRVRSHRLAPAAGQPQRPAHDRDGVRLPRQPAARPDRGGLRPDRGDRDVGPVGDPVLGAHADVPDRRAGSSRRVDRWAVASFVLPLIVLQVVWLLFLEQDGNVLLAFPDAQVAERGRQDPARPVRPSRARSPSSSSPCSGARPRRRGAGRSCRASRAPVRCFLFAAL